MRSLKAGEEVIVQTNSQVFNKILHSGMQPVSDLSFHVLDRRVQVRGT